ncbi:AraC family transcriptional regulator [Streptomyces sp. YIM 98790]|uniref:AraC family transcriptional regulator n=1 Tax=Streptomyces sp. YIM 98790 TaxID=2689077 RepID=UPI0028BE6561|nr:AraC family transcriptional regulator [Streptomyces sp. YIM 98790]
MSPSVPAPDRPGTADDPVPLHRLEVPAPQVLPFAMGTFDTIGPLSRAAFPHRHTFYEVTCVTSGSGRHVVDSAARPLLPPQLCAVVPGQVHHWADARRLRGWVVLFNADFLLAHPGDRELLHRLGGQPLLPLDGEQADAVTALLRELRREFLARAPGHLSVLQSLLHVLLVRAARWAERPARPAAAAGPAGPAGAARPAAAGEDDRARALAREFLALLATPGAVAVPLAGHAARLRVSAGYLTEAVRKATGRPPGRLLREARTLEAKRLLAATDLTVRQVASRVGYPDPAYFSRFFRRETGMSPGDFRRGSRADHHVHRAESLADGPAGS